MHEAADPAAGGVEWLVVATIRRPHGVRGELALAVETDRPDAVFRKGARLQLGDNRRRPAGGVLTVERARRANDGILLKAVEHAGRTPELEALRGRSLLIPASDAAPTTGDELHYRELVGMRVRAGDTPIGTIAEVVETAGGELLRIRRSGANDLLIPFVAAWIRGIDRAAREIRMEPPEGLMEL